MSLSSHQKIRQEGESWHQESLLLEKVGASLAHNRARAQKVARTQRREFHCQSSLMSCRWKAGHLGPVQRSARAFADENAVLQATEVAGKDYQIKPESILHLECYLVPPCQKYFPYAHAIHTSLFRPNLLSPSWKMRNHQYQASEIQSRIPET